MIFKRKVIHPVSLIIVFFVGITIFNCKPEEEIIDFEFNNGLEFSTDTILFDTVFTGIGSATKRLKVFNPSQNALIINSIELGAGKSSSYRILVNGTEPYSSEDLLILGKDSMLILVEVFINPQDEDSPFLVNDSIIFETNGIMQDIKLIAWGQNANYVGDEILDCNSNWTNDRPYVIYSSILVDTLCELTIDKGTRIYASKEAFLYVKGTLIAEGTPEERIIFRNDRLDFQYENTSGQWGGLVFLEGSHENKINFTTIRNAVFGVRLGSPDKDTIPDVILKNCIIENMSNSGILTFTSDLLAENTLVNNCIQFNCGNIAGGNYAYKHCTFANYGFTIIRQTPSFYITDYIDLDDNSSIEEDVFLQIQNTIIDGNLEDELLFDFRNGENSVVALNNNIFKSTSSKLDTLGNMLNVDPEFVDPAIYNYRLDTLSPAKDSGASLGIKFDLDGNNRDELPDMGAYERIE
jgi:hypothetical protein